MCEECRQHPCHPRCPNAVSEPLLICAWCEGEILEGEEYYDINQDIICPSCVASCQKVAEREEE